MSGSKGHVCPECGTHREADGTPSCACTKRASDALRDARTAEAAAAEDFDPLRIRPYVELGQASPGADPGPDGTAEPAGAGPRSDARPERPATRATPLPPETAAERTMPLTAADAPSPGERTMPLTAVGTPSAAERTRPVMAAGTSEPAPDDMRLFQDPTPGSGTTSPGDEPPRRRRRTALLVVAGAVVAVVAAAGLASGVLSYDTPERDASQPEAVRASVPEKSSPRAEASPSRSASPSPSASGSPTGSAGADASPSASPSSPSATPSRSKKPTGTPTTARATGSVRPPSDEPDEHRATILRRGDRGAEVAELQLRLRQLALYYGDINGNFNEQVEDAVRRYQWARGIGADEPGVYGTATRTRLESETSEP
ncbi:peptidoglycan-binding protein [Streptomyces sp. NPDC005481]|uniref:peptidoglycan-binding domain-containing protein n=1 Tax=Streptomyces sp. NPDC005481 TaxID=3154881 RepID=UPI0033AF2FC7